MDTWTTAPDDGYTPSHSVPTPHLYAADTQIAEAAALMDGLEAAFIAAPAVTPPTEPMNLAEALASINMPEQAPGAAEVAVEPPAVELPVTTTGESVPGLFIPQLPEAMRTSGPQIPTPEPYTVKEKAPWGLREGSTDIGNAERLAISPLRCEIAYSFAQERWFLWDGKIWVPEDHDRLLSTCAKVIDLAMAAAYKAAEKLPADDKDGQKHIKAILGHLNNSKNLARLKAMVELAKGMLVMDDSLVDANPDLLSVRNGTIDLSTGKIDDDTHLIDFSTMVLRKHDPKDFITKIVDVEYIPGATSPVWDKFLGEITQGDQYFARYLQRAMGYTITGHTHEQEMFVIHGPSKAGKSILLNTTGTILGPHAKAASSNTFESRRDNEGPRSDIVRLKGARMVVVSETGDGKEFDAKLIKSLTGGTDRLTVAAKYKDDQEFIPQFKLWFACNHKPRLDSTDGAIWKRINLIPFHNEVADADIDKTLAAKLLTPESAQAILAWAVAGCVAWRKYGLATPAIVTNYTGEYRNEMDGLTEFIEECCIVGDKEAVWVPTTEFVEAYRKWCKVNGQDHPLGPRKIQALLTHRGHPKQARGDSRTRCFMGISCDPNSIVVRPDSRS